MDRNEFYQRMNERLAEMRVLYQAKAVSLTQARIDLGTASWRERWAYRFPRALGRLSARAKADAMADLDKRRVAERQTRRS